MNKDKFKARAMLIGDRIDLRTLETADRLAASPLTFQVNGGGIADLFRYGACCGHSIFSCTSPHRLMF